MSVFLRRLELRENEEYLDFRSLNEKIKENTYTHPEQHPASIITQDGTHRFVSDEEKNTWNNKASIEKVTEVQTKANEAQVKADDAYTKANEAQVKADDAYTKAEEAFQSASDGKQKIATAITGMGVEVDGSQTFQELSEKIKEIKTKAIFS